MSKQKIIGMLVAAEMDSVLSRYGKRKVTERRAGFDVYIYHGEGYRLVVVHSGIGEIAAAAATALLIDRYEVEMLVNFGVVGGLTEAMTLTKTCVVRDVVHYDFDLSGIDEVLPAQYPGFDGIRLPADQTLMEKALAVCPALVPVSCASADKFVGNQEEKQRLHSLYGADICEMESAAVLLTCLRSGVPCLMIKAVSDGLTGGGAEYYAELNKAAALCLEVTDRIIREL